MKQKLIIDYFHLKPKDTTNEKIYGYNKISDFFEYNYQNYTWILLKNYI